jgi:hypothetical protein
MLTNSISGPSSVTTNMNSPAMLAAIAAA